jgi:hypothetical protein
VTIHALLHIADSIEWLGPPWAYWMFATERLCGEIPRAIKSRRFPFEAINNHLENMAHLSAVLLRFRLDLEPLETHPTHGLTLGNDCELFYYTSNYSKPILQIQQVYFSYPRN